MKLISFCNRVISSSFYLLFFLVPLIFWGDTSELFEFNKMWLTFTLAIVIACAWGTKMLLQKKIVVQKTPFDIPILLFLASQLIATISSLDRYVSLWGYYSRFNGGLLSITTYIFLYYACVSNLEKKHIVRILYISLFSGLLVALWGLPSHFGYDPTCYIFRGELNVDCWTVAFQPKVRIFSTLGQPDWMAAYLCVLIPLAIATGINAVKRGKTLLAGFLFALTALFYLDLLYTRARSGIVGLAGGLLFFFGYYLWTKRETITQIQKHWYIGATVMLLALLTFFVGTPISQLDTFTFAGIKNALTKQHTVQTASQAAAKPQSGEFGGTDSGKIRKIVWTGAVKIWEHYPLFGTGVETYAFAYYKFRPAEHNLTSEWDYLYNKAHNEFLNYLATTGLFGFCSYLAIIFFFFYVAIKKRKNIFTPPPSYPKHTQAILQYQQQSAQYELFVMAFIASYITILITNFFGFSVVIMNLYLFLIPAFVLFLENILPSGNVFVFPKKTGAKQAESTAPWQMITISVLVLFGGYFVMTLLTYWQADRAYGYGYNLDHAGYYQQASIPLHRAVEMKPQEPAFTDELSINDAAVAANLLDRKQATDAAKFAQEAILLSDATVNAHPNNVVFWKTRVRIFYTLSSFNQKYLATALQAIQKAHELAPTDAKISYNLGLLYTQNNQLDKAIHVMQDTIKLKPDYRDAYYALGLFYHQASLDKDGKIVKPELEKKAVDILHYALDHVAHNDSQIKEALKNWGEQ